MREIDAGNANAANNANNMNAAACAGGSPAPDSITGMIFAAEGLERTVTLLNGPMGCKFYHSTTSEHLTVRPPLYLPAGQSGGAEGKKIPVSYQFLDSFFFRQSRVPCTWLDGDDYVYGTSEQVREALAYLRDRVGMDLLVIVDSPGASLIGDDLASLCAEELPGTRTVILESPGYSRTFDEGYAQAGLEILRQGFAREIGGSAEAGSAAETAAAERRPRVNLLGLTIWQRYYEGDLRELERLFGLIGADVHAAFLAGASAEEIASLGEADLNVVVFPERGLDQACWLEETAGTSYYVFGNLPLGFAAVEEGFRGIAEILGTDAAPLLEESSRARALAYAKIRSIHEMSGLPEGARFHVAGDAAQIRAYGAFFTDYLGMVPAAAEEAELVFGDANGIAELMSRRDAFCGIEINYPGMGYTDLIPKTHLGIQGALFLIEQVLNGLMSRL